MIWLLVPLILLSFGSICNSIMDTVDHHQQKSIFSKFKNGRWWNQNQGWRNKYIDYDGDIKLNIEPRRVKWSLFGFTVNKPVQLTDSWHFFKMLMIIFISLSISTFLIFTNNIIGFLPFTVYLLLCGLIWNTTFRLFYHKFLLLKNEGIN